MLKIVVFCSTLVVIFGLPQPLREYDGRIVGGTPTTIEEYPYTVSVQLFGVHNCGGSIINEKFIVTAAHCSKPYPLNILSIRAGSTLSQSGGVQITIKTKIDHPNYNPITKDYDISVLELESPLIFSESISSIELLTDDPNAGTEGICTGWGRLTEGGEGTEILQEVTLPIVDRDECWEIYPGLITENMICAGYLEGGKDACQGDSGGPLAIDGKLAGVVSFGSGCARPGIPGVYTNVAALNSFIIENTRI